MTLYRTLAAVGLILALPGAANALEPGEAEAVVAIMEQLAVESGEGMFHGGGDIAYELDSYGLGLIPAAGFTEESWVVAHDAVTTGYMATFSQEEFDAIFAEPLAMLEAADLPADQKQALRADMEMHIAEAQAARREGAAFAETVRPLAPRLEVLFFGAFGE